MCLCAFLKIVVFLKHEFFESIDCDGMDETTVKKDMSEIKVEERGEEKKTERGRLLGALRERNEKTDWIQRVFSKKKT